MKEDIHKIPKIELHMHIDGSIPLDLVSKMTGFKEIKLKKVMCVDKENKSLTEYLRKFKLPISLMQTKESLKSIAKDIVDKLALENVVYAELRFAPMYHTTSGLFYDEIVASILEGLNENKKVKTNLILCMMRGAKTIDNIKTILTAEKFLNKGVCAIDLAGDESKYPIDDYLILFDIAKQKGIPFTIHAGETGSYEEIKKAVKIGAKRIGHGISAILDENTINLLKKENVLLEVCPTSNTNTLANLTYSNHPVKKLFDKGVKVSINTDNRTVSDTTLTEEYIHLKSMGFTISDIKKMNKDALNSAFISNKEKEELLKKLN